MLDGWLATEASPAQVMNNPETTGYVAHRKWAGSNGNGYVVDRFNSHPEGIHRARAAARLDNGDVVVVGDIESDIAHNRSLGIVKYNSRGQRVPWTNVSSDFGVFNNQYIRFPGTSSWGTTREVIWVHQVMATSTHMYVLLTIREGAGPRRPAIMRWRHDGSGFAWNLPALPASDSGTYRDAVAMDIWGPHMIVLGRRSIDINDGDGGFWIRRYTIQVDGSLTGNGDAVNVTPQAAIGYRRFIPADIAFRRTSVDVPVQSPAFAVVATIRAPSNERTRACLFRYLPDNAHNNDWYCVTEFETGRRHWASSLHSQARAFATPPLVREVLFIASTVHYDRADAIRLTKLVDNQVDAVFGTGGSRIYGGCSDQGAGEGCAPGSIPATAHIPLNKALYADTGGVYLAGRTFRAGRSGDRPTRRPIFMHVDPDNGEMISLQVFGNSPNSRFAALVPGKVGSAGVHEFTVVGHGYDQEQTEPDPVAPSYFLSAHLVRRSDLIFHNGLQPIPPLSEGFHAIETLPAAGWLMRNNSAPLGMTNWFQGNPNEFSAQAGAADSYIAANFYNAGDPGTISNWLITPRLTFGNASSLSFWTRGAVGGYPDRLEVRLCTGSPCTDVGNTATSEGGFTTVLLTINQALTPGGYPQTWTQYTLTSAQGLPTSGHGRVAFRYFRTRGNDNGGFIGIDTVAIQATGIDGTMAPEAPASSEDEP